MGISDVEKLVYRRQGSGFLVIEECLHAWNGTIEILSVV